MKSLIFAYTVAAVIGYLVGAVNPSYLIARHRGFDIRSSGSGNAGGSNALITMGKPVGILCICFDIAKAFLCVRLMPRLFPHAAMVYSVTAVCCVLGHIFPCFLRFRGGKGLACLGGVILGFSPAVFGIMLACEAVFLLISQYLCFVPITAAAIFPIVYYRLSGSAGNALLLGLLFPVIVYKHLPNLRRIRAGTELRIRYLWSKTAERERAGYHEEPEEEDRVQKI